MLPTKKSVPESDLTKYLIMLYGKPGTGKTTLAAQFENPLFLMCEPGAKSLSVYKKDISSWKKLVATIDELETEKHSFKTVVIDTYSQAYEMCTDYVCRSLNVTHPSEAKWGRGWDAVYQEFAKQMSRLTFKYGTVLICHAAEKEIEQLDGTDKIMIAPDTKSQSMKFITRAVDLVGYYYYGKSGKRYIRIQAKEDVMAKNRIDGHFVGVPRISAGNNPKEAYRNLIKAFNTTGVSDAV